MAKVYYDSEYIEKLSTTNSTSAPFVLVAPEPREVVRVWRDGEGVLHCRLMRSGKVVWEMHQGLEVVA